MYNTFNYHTIYYFFPFKLPILINQNFIFQIKKDDFGYLRTNTTDCNQMQKMILDYIKVKAFNM